MSIDPQPRKPRTLRAQLVSRTDRPTPNVNRAAPVNKPRLNKSLRVRDKFTKACASRRVIDLREWPDTLSVTFRAWWRLRWLSENRGEVSRETLEHDPVEGELTEQVQSIRVDGLQAAEVQR